MKIFLGKACLWNHAYQLPGTVSEVEADNIDTFWEIFAEDTVR
jgi:hypothetical protein